MKSFLSRLLPVVTLMTLSGTVLSSATPPAESKVQPAVQRRSNPVKRTPKNLTKASDGKICRVTCVLEGERRPYFAIYNDDYSADVYSKTNSEDGYISDDSYVFCVPEGTYDVATYFRNPELEEMGASCNVVRESVEITDDVTLTFETDEATERVAVKPILRNGDELCFPTVTYLDEEPWEIVDDSNANAEYLFYYYTLFREGCEAINNGALIAQYVGSDVPDAVVYTNKLSDKYHFLVYTCITVNADEYEISTTDVAGMKTCTVDTYNKDFVKFPMPEFSRTPLYNKVGVESNNSIIMGSFWVDNITVGGSSSNSPSTNPSVYVASQPTNGVDVKVVITPGSIQADNTVVVEEEYNGEIYETTRRMKGLMFGLPSWYDNGKWEYINQNHSLCGTYVYQIPETGPVVEYPGLEPYCFYGDEVNQPFGNSAPILVIGSNLMDYEGFIGDEYAIITGLYFAPEAWIGRFGEVRNCDTLTATTVVTDGEGEILYDSKTGGDWRSWLWNYFPTQHDPVKLQVEFVDTNVLVDGEIEGFNRTVMEIDENNEDLFTPTPQMLVFKNMSGVITDRFTESKDGVIEFSAGDFNWLYEENCYAVEEAEVKVEYAPYGAGSWNPIEVEEIPENFYMPGFGYFYRGSLECVDVPSANSWYDLRFTLTDKAGNKTMEHISPAFRVSNVAGVEGTNVDGVHVWHTDGFVRTDSDATSIDIYTPDGRCIAHSIGDEVRTDGIAGVILVRLTLSDGRMSTHKLVL